MNRFLEYISENGPLYRILIDPLLRSLRKKIVPLVGQNCSVIDVACGTGALTFLLAGKARNIVGVDLSESMIRTALKMKSKKSAKNVEFMEIDATRMDCFCDSEFDIAVISMGLHQFTFDTALSIVREMQRISREMIIVDYASPLPDNHNGLTTRFFEILGGKEHNMNFKSYIANGGLHAFLPKLASQKILELTTNDNIFSIVKYQKNGSAML